MLQVVLEAPEAKICNMTIVGGGVSVPVIENSCGDITLEGVLWRRRVPFGNTDIPSHLHLVVFEFAKSMPRLRTELVPPSCARTPQRSHAAAKRGTDIDWDASCARTSQRSHADSTRPSICLSYPFVRALAALACCLSKALT
jgi:hypothetical protein